MARSNTAPPRVFAPAPSRDRALSSRIGLVAVIGFSVGVAWPRLIGFKVGPSVPGSQEGAVVAVGSASAVAPTPDETAVPALAASAPGVSNKQRAIPGAGVMLGCRNKKGDKPDDCGKLAIDKAVQPKLEQLAVCPSAIGLEGVVDFKLTFDFDKKSISVSEAEKSKLPSATVRGVLKCTEDALGDVELERVVHTHPKYTLSFRTEFFPPGKEPAKVEDGKDEARPTDADDKDEGKLGRASISWEKALVRETPRDGKVIARLPQGTRVKLVAQDDDWYQIESGSTKGWLYRQAIGK